MSRRLLPVLLLLLPAVVLPAQAQQRSRSAPAFGGPRGGVAPRPAGGHVGVAPRPAGGHVGVAPRPAGGHVGVAPRPAGGHVGVAPRPAGGHVGVAPRPGGGHPGAGHVGFGPRPPATHSGFTSFPRRVLGPSFVYSYGYPPFYAYYPLLPPLPPALLPEYTTVIADAEQPSFYWSPTSRIITGPVNVIVIQGGDRRVIGMGIPGVFQPDPEPLGDVARRLRAESAQTRTGQRYVLRIEQ